jgi:outer membrane protein TolC
MSDEPGPTRGRRLLALLTGLTLLAGCLPDSIRQQQARSAVDARLGLAAPQEPWHEPWLAREPAAVRALVEEAWRENPDVQVARANLLRALAEYRLLEADRLPQLEGSLQGGQVQDRGEQDVAKRWTATASLSWSADLWGRLRLIASAGEVEIDSAYDDARGAALSVAVEVVLAWYELNRDRQLEDIYRQTEKLLGEQRLALDDRLRRGSADKVDGLVLLSDERTAAAATAAARSRRVQVSRRLHALLGRGVLDEQTLPEPEEIPQPPAPNTDVPIAAVLSRPDVRSAERKIQASGLRVEAARRAFLPDLTISGQFAVDAVNPSGLGDVPVQSMSLLAGLTAPLIDGGRLRMRHQVARADLGVALSQYRKTLIGAIGELDQQAEDERLQGERSRLLHEAATAAADSAQALSERYRTGSLDLFDLLAAQRRLADVRSQAADARFQAYSAHLRRCLATGCAPEDGFDDMLRRLLLDRIVSEALP